MRQLNHWPPMLCLLGAFLFFAPTVMNGFSQTMAGPNLVFGPELSESVPLIRANEVHQLGITGQGIVVVVIDNFTPHPDDPCSNTFIHGEWVKGVVQAVAPGAEVRTIDVPLDVPGTPERPCFGFSSEVLESALQSALSMQRSNPFHVANYSIGGGRFSDWCDSSVTPTGLWIRRLVEEGVHFVTASGNAGFTDATGFPECMRETIAVGAVYDYNANVPERAGVCSALPVIDRVTCYSNSAFFLDVLAPGSAIRVSPRLDSLGTSAASPHVAGVIALMLQLDPTLTLEDIRNLFNTTGKPVLDHRNNLTFPRVDALAAVQAVMARINRPPQVSLRIEPATPVVGRPVFFNADASDPDGDSLTYAWTLNGEAQAATTNSTQWEAPTLGTHTIRVEVSDGRGGLASAERTFEVRSTESVPNSLAEALDQNNNRIIDDDEIELAIRLWITGQPAPNTALLIDDNAIEALITLWIRAEPVSG